MQFKLLCCRDIHINAKGHASQNVSISTQLFSKTVASAFEVFGMPAHAWFVLTVNNFFDVMNSTAVEHTNKLKCAYGVHESQQREALVNMEKLLLDMKFENLHDGLAKLGGIYRCHRCFATAFEMHMAVIAHATPGEKLPHHRTVRH